MDTFSNPVFCALAVFFTVLFLLNLRSFLKIVPSLWDCVIRWKGNISLEDSIQLARSRSWIAAILFVPFCLVVYSYDLYSPAFLDGMSPTLRLAVVSGVLVAYLLIRAFLNWQLEMHRFGTPAFSAANRSFYNYCIILFFLIFASGAILRALGCEESLLRSVLLWEITLSYVIYCFRRGQIFASVCNPFSTFLYLCSLELIPTCALVLSAKLF